MRDVSGALRWLETQARDGEPVWFNRCLMLARYAAGIDARWPEADQAWAATRFRSEPQPKPPPGWFVWWDRPGNPGTDHDAGHVAVSAGNGLVWSNDVRRRGHVDLVKITAITAAWGLPRVGDSRDVNGVVFVPAASRPPAEPEKPRLILVRKGDTLSELVAKHSHVKDITWGDVWRDPHNAGLRRRRGKPELIQPGDHVWVP